MMMTLTLDEGAAIALATVVRRVDPVTYGVDEEAFYRALDQLHRNFRKRARPARLRRRNEAPKRPREARRASEHAHGLAAHPSEADYTVN